MKSIDMTVVLKLLFRFCNILTIKCFESVICSWLHPFHFIGFNSQSHVSTYSFFFLSRMLIIFMWLNVLSCFLDIFLSWFLLSCEDFSSGSCMWACNGSPPALPDFLTLPVLSISYDASLYNAEHFPGKKNLVCSFCYCWLRIRIASEYVCLWFPFF